MSGISGDASLVHAEQPPSSKLGEVVPERILCQLVDELEQRYIPQLIDALDNCGKLVAFRIDFLIQSGRYSIQSVRHDGKALRFVLIAVEKARYMCSPLPDYRFKVSSGILAKSLKLG